MSSKLEILQSRLGLTFRSPQLLQTALEHSSYAYDQQQSRSRSTDVGLGGNERLEFLGDAVLGLVASEYLFEHFPDLREGAMSRKRSKLVCEKALAVMARRFDLGAYLSLGKTEIQMQGQNKDSLLADAFEALLGALYLDQGLAAVRCWVHTWLPELCVAIDAENITDDYKTELQEWVQSKGAGTPTYRTVDVKGPDHSPQFEVVVLIADEEVARGLGASKKKAAQSAAQQALLTIRQEHRLRQECDI